VGKRRRSRSLYRPLRRQRRQRQLGVEVQAWKSIGSGPYLFRNASAISEKGKLLGSKRERVGTKSLTNLIRVPLPSPSAKARMGD